MQNLIINNWQKVKLGEIAKIVDCPHSTPSWTDVGYFVVRNYNLSNGRIIKEKASYTNYDNYVYRTKRAVPKVGDSILSREAPIGQVGYVNNEEKLCLGQRVVLIQPKKIDAKFLLYQLISPSVQRQFKRSDGSGSTVSNLRLPLIENTLVDLPDPQIQIRIASALSTYDDLIENNEKRIKTLEEMAQLLYTEWFVKFKFPGHEKVKMVDSGTKYDKIPEGWKVKKLSEVANIIRGRSYSSEDINDFIGDYYMVNLKSFNRGGGFRFDGVKYFSGTINSNQSLEAGDIVVAVTDMTTDRAVIARPARVPEINGQVTFSADVVKINSDVLPNSFLYKILSSYRFTETTKQKANGANVLHLKPTAILEYDAIIPDHKSLIEFAKLCEPAINEVDKLVKQIDILIKTRDLLIPQLVTGKREIKN